jgi:hypothetical protein
MGGLCARLRHPCAKRSGAGKLLKWLTFGPLRRFLPFSKILLEILLFFRHVASHSDTTHVSIIHTSIIFVKKNRPFLGCRGLMLVTFDRREAVLPRIEEDTYPKQGDLLKVRGE